MLGATAVPFYKGMSVHKEAVHLHMGSIVVPCMYKLISLVKTCTSTCCTRQCNGSASAPVGSHVFRAVSQACSFSQRCGSTRRLPMFSAVGTPPSQLCQQGSHTGSAAQWAVWESEGSDRGGRLQDISREYMCA